MPSPLSMIGLASARRAKHLAEQLQTAERRAAELKQALADARDDAQRWKTKARELTQQLEQFEKAAERLPVAERELERARDRIAHLGALKQSLEGAERTIALSQDHLVSTESKLDVIEAAIAVLDMRTRSSAGD